jgi:hypothetical protein
MAGFGTRVHRAAGYGPGHDRKPRAIGTWSLARKVKHKRAGPLTLKIELTDAAHAATGLSAKLDVR